MYISKIYKRNNQQINNNNTYAIYNLFCFVKFFPIFMHGWLIDIIGDCGKTSVEVFDKFTDSIVPRLIIISIYSKTPIYHTPLQQTSIYRGNFLSPVLSFF